jgi:hypothetical protein
MNPNWRDTMLLPRYAGVVADPRVKEAMQRWEAEEVALRGSVRTYFSDLQAAM